MTAEVAVVSRGLEHGPVELERANDGGRPKIESSGVLLGDLVVTGAPCVDPQGDRIRQADGVGDLDFSDLSQTAQNDLPRHITGEVSRATVDFGCILAAECSSAVTGCTSIGIDDDLASGYPAVGLGSAEVKGSGRVDQNLGLRIEP